MGLMDAQPRLTKGQVFRYIFFPQILPRINAFAESGFVNLASLVAQVYASIGLLPRTHAIFQPGGRKNLSLRYVIACAAQNLTWSRSHIDQIIVFIAILVGMVLLVLQFVMLLGFIAMKPAFAQMPEQYGDFFMNPEQKTDIAYRMLWTVFGVPELFKEGGARSEYHIALHSLFQLYSVGMLVIAVIITCYFIFAVLAETAQTGVPFGKRYNHVWTPIRLVVALGLLIPVGYGLNSAQWITLYTAKFGSDFATKGWVLFNETMTQAYLEKPEERVGTPKVPDINALPAFMMTAFACDYAYEKMYGSKRDIQGYIITSETGGAPPLSLGARVSGDQLGKGDIMVVFGQYDPDKTNNNIGKVVPYCGQMIIPLSDATEPGSESMRDSYFSVLYVMNYGLTDIRKYAQNMVDAYMEITPDGESRELPPPDWRGTKINSIRDQVKTGIASAVRLQGTSETWNNDIADVKAQGWGGAGIWYNKIAQINGSLIAAVNSVPQVKRMPETMELIRRESLQQNRNAGNGFSTDALSEDLAMQPANPIDVKIGKILLVVYNYWNADDRSQGALANQTKLTGNAVIDVINAVFGTQGLFAMCQNTDTHPLAQLSILGKGLVDASIRNIMGGAGLSIVQAILPGQFGAFMGAASGMLFSIASITIVMGFMLYYVLPFMPFLYFFFAVAGWVKGLFEAMVGMPLWALAHLRIDGEGLPGSAGLDGYYLVFEIFIRPILIVFGLLASVVIFAAMVKVLNEIFHLVVQNLSGHDPNATTLCGEAAAAGGDGGGAGGDGGGGGKDPMEYFRGPIDELFYTVLYAIIVYMIGMSCFKLIDLVPNNILRYMGSSANTFNDKASDPAEGLMRNISIGGSMVSSKVLGEGGIVPSAAGGSNRILTGVTEAMKTDKDG